MPLHDTQNILAKGSGPDATAVARRKASLLKQQRQLRRELRSLQETAQKDLALLERERQELRDGRRCLSLVRRGTGHADGVDLQDGGHRSQGAVPGRREGRHFQERASHKVVDARKSSVPLQNHALALRRHRRPQSIITIFEIMLNPLSGLSAPSQF